MSLKERRREILERLIGELAGRCPSDQAGKARTLFAELFKHAAPEDLVGRRPEDLCAAASSQWELIAQRGRNEPKVRLYTPVLERRDWRSAHSVVEVVTDDMPFLVDSVRMALHRHGLTVHVIAHAVVSVRRDNRGRLIEFGARGADAIPESIMYIEVERRTAHEVLEHVHADILRALADVRAAVTDWPKMRAKVHEILSELAAAPPPVDPGELAESRAFLAWIEDHHFTFLGYRLYELVQENGDDVLRLVPGSALGTAPAAGAPMPSQTFSALPPEYRAAFRAPRPLVLTKANVRSTVHRPLYMDYIGVKRFDDRGDVVGEHRFLGLYTSTAYNRSPRDIPLLRRKVQSVFARAGLDRQSHDGKALLNILETYPRDELFQIGEDELLENAMGILALQERQRVRLFVRQEPFGRFVSCIVFVPRDRYDTSVRESIEMILLHAFNGESADYMVHLSESVLARIYFIIHTAPGSVFDYDRAELEARIAARVRTWEDELQDVLIETLGEVTGDSLFRRYRHAFPAAYREDFNPRAAARDIADVEELSQADGPVLALYQPLSALPGHFRFKMFSGGEAIALSDILPMLEHMGARVIRERPYEIKPEGGEPAWIYDFALAGDRQGGPDIDAVRESFQNTFADVWRGVAENDGFNRLVLRASLTCREITVIRAYARYLRQTGVAFSQPYMEEILADNGHIARLLVEFLHARFGVDDAAHRDTRRSRLHAELHAALDAVESLDEDRILRAFVNAVQATVRTNFYQLGADGRPKAYLAFKLDPRLIPDLPLPRPMYEIFVYSPRVEGVHLRGGRVARGGIRWSDRREDFRTEILGLMKAQMVKNAIIVPVGAKGGFVVKRPPADRAELREEVVECYRTLIRGMLDLTDNIAGDRVVGPPRVVRYDEDDPYLVVAADKGTATFSDVANGIAKDYGFWLGDAFASGGSSGYDHKKMGITARGAWEAVKRHFRELGLDIQERGFTVIGIGDMSGDVFGNGMLQSEKIKLIGAFDHRHVFIDPDPDPEKSYAERRRLFKLPRSSWADYDPKLISEGGGVYPRTAKSIKLSPPVRQVLGIHAESLPPDHLIRALLKAPVDLLWNGGIGTYVKARSESHADVDDRANDGLRVNARDLRCRVVGEGGNLGVTQKGRIEYALKGGRINTDFIDNAGGVSCSDYEVNIKILLNAAVAGGALSETERDPLLAAMTGEVATLVLAENYWQTWAISIMEAQSAALLDEHARYMRWLEREGRLDRALEFLPDDDTLAERRVAKRGLTRPELAVLVAYAKATAYQQLLDSDAIEDPFLERKLAHYFPRPLRERFVGEIRSHRLRRELIATFVTNRMVNRLGATFTFRMQEENGADAARTVRAYAAIWEIFGLRRLASAIAGMDNQIAADVQLRMMLALIDLVQRGTSWLLSHAAASVDIAAMVERYQPAARSLADQLPLALSPDQVAALETGARPLVEAGVPVEVAQQVARLEPLYSALDVAEVGYGTDVPVERAARVYFALEARLDLGWLRDRIAELPADNRWHTRARTALDEELYAQQRLLATEVLSNSGAAGPPEQLLDAWSAHSNGAVDRYLQLTADLKSAAPVDMPTLSVAVKEIGALRRNRT